MPRKKTEVVENVEQILPLVTLRGLTITPNSKLQIVAARPSSIAAFKYAFEHEPSELAVFCQLNEADEAPDFDGIHKTGVLCSVHHMKKRDENTYECVLSGSKRIKLMSIVESQEEYRLAKIVSVVEPVLDDKEIHETIEILKSCLNYALDNSERSSQVLIDSSIPKKIIENVLEESSLSKLTDVLTQILRIDTQTKLMLLSTLNPIERAHIIISALNGYSYKSELEAKVIEQAKQSMEKNQKEYYLSEQLKAIKKELGINKDDDDAAVLLQKARELKAPKHVHARLEREIKKLSSIAPSSSEYTVIRNYIDNLLNIPWQVSTPLKHNLKESQEILDKEHYGLTKVKDKILEYLAVQSRVDKLNGPIICLMGPPGIGKTSLGQSIAKATGRKYVRVALGGVSDEAEIRGHRRTYIGALPGRIISNMVKVGVNNPLFLLDEIDKLAQSNHGDPSAALLEVLDPEQNSTFEDNYVELEYDLSNVMFVTTANSYNIPRPLLDRMEIIDLSSYTEEEKFNIARRHLLPKQLRLANLKEDDLLIDDKTLLALIQGYTHEAGVRNLERILTEIVRKCVKKYLTENPGSKDFKQTKVSLKMIEQMLGPVRYDFTSKLNDNKVGVVNGLSWSTVGGDILQLETVANEGKGKHQLTGKLGAVMKESITTAITVVRTLSKDLKLDPNFFETSDLHVHVPEGAVPKDGPSAGIGMVTAVVSALTGNPVRADVAMTGEITLRGDVLPIGGLKEKLLAALRGGIKTVLIPEDNLKDLWEVPKIVTQKMKVIGVKRIEVVLENALENDPFKFKPTTVWKAKSKTRARTTKKVEKDNE